MTDENERIYDEEIAPLLAQAAKKATAHNIPLFALAEYGPGNIGETRSAYRGACFPFVFAQAAFSAQGNLDAFVISVLRFCKDQGIPTDASIIAHLMEGQKPS